MTGRKLRKALKVAKEGGKIGLLIWANPSVQQYCASDITNSNATFNDSMQKDFEEIYCTWKGLIISGAILVSVANTLSSKKSFQNVLLFCKRNHFEGPIVFISKKESD